MRNYLIAAGVLLLACFLSFQYGKTKAKTVTKVEQVEVVKTKVDTVTVVKEVKQPDGTIVKETTVTDKSVINSKTDVRIEVAKNKNKINLGTDYSFSDKKQTYNFTYERRVLGDVWLGARASTDGTVGVQVGLEF